MEIEDESQGRFILRLKIPLLLGVASLILLQNVQAAPTITKPQVGGVDVTATMPADKDFLTTNKDEIFAKGTTTLTINVTASGTYNGTASSSYGILADATNSKNLSFSGFQSIEFHIDTTQMTGSNGSQFFSSKGTSIITFESDLAIDFTQGSNIGKGVFYSAPFESKDPGKNDQTGTFVFKKGLKVDTTGTTDGNGASSYIFNLDEFKAETYVNYNNLQGNTGSVLSQDSIIQLTGDINLNGQNAILGINLSNANSYIKGAETYTAGKLNLGLNNGGKWIVTKGDVNINELQIVNNTKPTNFNSKELTDNISLIDIATERMDTGFVTPQNVKIQTLKSGNNGVIRTMIDLPNNQGDLVTIQNQEIENAAQTLYLQLFQKGGYTLTKDASLKVAEIINKGDNLTIEALPLQMGLYNYHPSLAKERQDNGYKWVIYEKALVDDENKTPAPVQDSLDRALSLQYRIYRIHTDSIRRHIDELVPTFTHHHVWFNYFIGSQGRQDYSRDDYQTFQMGYDWGANTRGARHLMGGLFDYTKMKNFDIDYDGQVNSFGLGAYYQVSMEMSSRASFDVDATMKYAYSSNDFFGKNNLSSADFVKSYHLFYLGARLGSKIDLDRRRLWFLEPSATATLGFMNGGYINMVDLMTQRNFGAQQEMATFISTRVNLAAGRRFVSGNIYFDVRARTYYAYDSNTGGDVMLMDVDPANRIFYQTPADNRWGIGLDANFALGEGFKLYSSIERTFFSHYDTFYLFYIGVRVSLDDLISGALFGGWGGRRDDNTTQRQRTQRHPRGKVVFGNNNRPLPKIISD